MPRQRTDRKPQWPFVLDAKSEQSRGLIGWWPGYPLSGNKLLDMSGYGRNGTLTNFGFTTTSGWNVGKDGGSALWFDGSNDFVNLGDNFGGLARITLSCWVLCRSTPAASFHLVAKFGNNDALDASDSFTMYFYGAEASFDSILGGPNKVVRSAIGQPLNTPTLVTMTYNGATLQMYLNGRPSGVAVAGSGALNAAAGTATYLGYSVGPTFSNPLNGWLDDVRIYNRALSASEVWSLYDPQTRWELRKIPNRQAILATTSVPALPKVLRRRMGS